ncbi:hypothetical protein [Sphingomonas sp.]|uniref:hypothetical protein n=1 Tax=Sphingomonas sp. TaxID=28214 RepID=UPI0017FB8E1B|nr:hypothetical protein [Sphingomonas sp.]MBA3512612.1 hypothetical protein [Sphingomonas sp.]
MKALERRLVALEGPNGMLEYKRWTDERLNTEIANVTAELRRAGSLLDPKRNALLECDDPDRLSEMIRDLEAEFSREESHGDTDAQEG